MSREVENKMIELNKIIDSHDNIIRRWEMTGLLEDIPDEEKADIAHLLHAALLYLSHDDVDANISVLFIPAILKIYEINKCVSIKFKVLELMLESAVWWAHKLRKLRKKSLREKLVAFFVKISILNLSSPNEKIESERIEEHVVEQVCIDYTEKFCRHGNAFPTSFNCGEPLNYCRECWVSNAEKKKCEHGKGMTAYCLPCNRINNA